ncbi:hypothetical protein BCEN4_860024 [Burkholderia cenocepacia]|nr:hypothetical protein BCEN4_860024 [Burkholderia cenocepacia]
MWLRRRGAWRATGAAWRIACRNRGRVRTLPAYGGMRMTEETTAPGEDSAFMTRQLIDFQGSDARPMKAGAFRATVACSLMFCCRRAPRRAIALLRLPCRGRRSRSGGLPKTLANLRSMTRQG